MNDTPLISVIIPTYNRAHLIKRSAKSVLNQTYKNLELIIIDDGSTDNTKEVINSLNDKRIVYVKQENQGVSMARNNGVATAKGKYIAFQDSDDVWHLDKLEKQLFALQKNNADIVFCKILQIGNLRKRKEPTYIKYGFLPKNILPFNIYPQSLLGKAEIFKNNFFDKTIQGIEDFDLAIRIHKKYSFYCIKDALIDYYMQGDSLSLNCEKRIADLKTIINKNDNFLTNYSPKSLELLAYNFLYAVFGINDSKKRKDALSFILTISNSTKIKTACIAHQLHLFKIRGLLYKALSVPIKKIIKPFKKKTS
jgi:glycosyltransferase involved in cell wall biosynthesis